MKWSLVAVTLAAFAVMWSERFVGARISNDQLFNIATGFDLRDQAEPLDAFRRQAVAACEGNRECVYNQVVLVSEMPFNYPIAAATGLFLARNGIPMNFSAFALEATGISLTLGLVAAVVLFVLGLTQLDDQQRLLFGALMAMAMAMLIWGPHRTLPFDLLSLNRPETVLGLLVITLALPVAAALILDRLSAVRTSQVEIVLLIVALAVAVFARFQGSIVAGIVAVAVASSALAVSLSRTLPSWAAAVIVLGCIFGLSSSDFLAPLVHAAPRANGFFAILPILVAIMLRPNSLAIALLPMIALFHLSSASLIAAIVFGVEVWLTFWGKGSRIAIFVAGATAGALLLYSRFFFTGLTENVMSPMTFIAHVANVQILAALGVVAIFVATATWLAHKANRPACARALLYISAVFLLHQISGQFNDFNMFESGLYIIARASVYCAPPLITAAIFCLLIETRFPASANLPPRAVYPFGGSLVALLAIWSVPQSPSIMSLVQAPHAAWTALNDPESNRPLDFMNVKYDSTYWMHTGTNSATDALKFLSYVKLRFKLHDDPRNGTQLDFRLLSPPSASESDGTQRTAAPTESQ